MVAEQSGAVGADNGNTAIAILSGGECDGIVVIARTNHPLSIISSRNRAAVVARKIEVSTLQLYGKLATRCNTCTSGRC